MIAIAEAYRAGLLNKKNWLPNIFAGLIVGVVALPLAMAFAIASGVKPQEGLYTAIVAALVVGVFGGSRVQIAGPTGAFVVILAGVTAKFGFEGLQIATFLAGIFLLLMGAIKLGSVIKYIPDPVIVGFTSGIGCIIFVGEWQDFFGLHASIPIDAHFHQKLWLLIKSFPTLNYTTTLLACAGLLLILLGNRFFKRIPGPLVAMLALTAAQFYWHPQIATLGSKFGGIPQTLPRLHIPEFSFNRMLDLIGPAFTIALLGAIESLLSATAADNMAQTKHNSNQELIGQGLANLLTPLLGGFAATGAIARTATNIKQGGNSPIASIVHSILLISVILFMAPLAAYVPLCVLAAILFVVSYNMSDVPRFVHLLKHAPVTDVIVLLTTFLLTIFVNLVVAVNVGVILAMLFFIGRMQQHVSVKEFNVHDLDKNIRVYNIEGPVFFAVAEKIEQAILTLPNSQVMIFRLKDVPFMDMTGFVTFHKLIDQYHQSGKHVYVCEANSFIHQRLTKLEVTQKLKDNKIFDSFSDVLNKVAS